jgi:hypothetical protein
VSGRLYQQGDGIVVLGRLDKTKSFQTEPGYTVFDPQTHDGANDFWVKQTERERENNRRHLSAPEGQTAHNRDGLSLEEVYMAESVPGDDSRGEKPRDPGWADELNRAYMQSVIDHRATVLLASDPHKPGELLRDNNRKAAVFAGELEQLDAAGYTRRDTPSGIYYDPPKPKGL